MADPPAPLFDTPHGTVSGSLRDGVVTWRAVPVADTTAFGAPAPPTAWDGVLDCADTRERRALRSPTTASVFAPRDAVGKDAGATALPVIAWIHGGRYEEGHGDDGWFDGSTLAAAGCVVVTLNHRLRFEGFLPLDEDAPGRFRGTDDLVHALRWVRDSVAQIGGDPSNVTLVGQSAGGGLTMTLLTDRRADDLFHRAVVLSPGLPRMLPRVGWRVRRAVARCVLGVPLTRSRVEKVPVDRRERAYRRMAAVYASDIAVGPAPVDLSALREVPLLVSTMQDEFVRFPGVVRLDRLVHRFRLPSWTVAPGMLLLGVPWRRLPDWCRYVDEADAPRPMGRTVGDAMIRRWAAVLLSQAKGRSVWSCEFRGGDWNGTRIDAQHCGELPLLFGTLTVGRGLVHAMCGPDAVTRLTGTGERFRSAVLSFARGEGPGWEPGTTRVFSLVGGPDLVVSDPLRRIRELLPSQKGPGSSVPAPP